MKCNQQRLIGTKEIASYLSCDERTVRRWRRKYNLPAFRVGGRIEATIVDIEKWRTGQGRTCADNACDSP